MTFTVISQLSSSRSLPADLSPAFFQLLSDPVCLFDVAVERLYAVKVRRLVKSSLDSLVVGLSLSFFLPLRTPASLFLGTLLRIRFCGLFLRLVLLAS